MTVATSGGPPLTLAGFGRTRGGVPDWADRHLYFRLALYSSNVLAMVGLRWLYFVLSLAIERLRYLRQGLAIVLVFSAIKLLGGDKVHISPGESVGIIALVLGLTIALSLWPRRPHGQVAS